MTLETQIAIAILNKVSKIDTDKRIIVLPTPQTSGTDYQNETYARIKAREIIDKNKISVITREITNY